MELKIGDIVKHNNDMYVIHNIRECSHMVDGEWVKENSYCLLDYETGKESFDHFYAKNLQYESTGGYELVSKLTDKYFNNEVKFKPGNKVKIIKGHFIDRKGNNAIIEEAQLCQNHAQYSILDYTNGGGSAWYSNDDFELVDEGGQYLIDECHEKRKEYNEQQEDLKYIVDHYRETKEISSTSALKLFSEIGYQSSFLRNGEWFVFQMDWDGLGSIFYKLFDEGLDSALNEVERVFKSEHIDKYKANVSVFYDKVKCA